MPRASTAINIVQRVGGSIGTALVAVVLEHQIRVQVHGISGGLTGASTASRSVVARVAQPFASAFGNTFWWVVGMTVVALIPALLLVRAPARAAGRPRPHRLSVASAFVPARGSGQHPIGGRRGGRHPT